MAFEILCSRTFGRFSRYRLDVCRDRFGRTVYMVADAERSDPETGLPAIIRQADTAAEILTDLDNIDTDWVTSHNIQGYVEELIADPLIKSVAAFKGCGVYTKINGVNRDVPGLFAAEDVLGNWIVMGYDGIIRQYVKDEVL